VSSTGTAPHSRKYACWRHCSAVDGVPTIGPRATGESRNASTVTAISAHVTYGRRRVGLLS
jgi:hypothetical protein